MSIYGNINSLYANKTYNNIIQNQICDKNNYDENNFDENNYDDYLLSDVRNFDFNKIIGNDMISKNYNEDDANKINNLIYKINNSICGRVCVSPYLHGLYFLKELMKDNCKVYVEIGVFFGGSMILLMNQKTPCLFIGIDPFKGYYIKDQCNDEKFGYEDPMTGIPVSIRITEHNIKKNNQYNHEWYLIQAESNSTSATHNLNNLLKNKMIDLLFIDGDHSYEGVIQDFKLYHKLVNVNGYIVFDNYSSGWQWPGVQKAVDEIKSNINKYGYKFVLVYGRPEIENVGAMVIIQRTR
tara:strand:- start:643 stop:1530 length:888 start_codon:yes stop_codon:yes gene_type:complete